MAINGDSYYKRITKPLPQKCPQCGQEKVDFQYVGDPKTRIGYLDTWCSGCHTGIHISRVRIPENAFLVTFDTLEESILERIPNFVQVIP